MFTSRTSGFQASKSLRTSDYSRIPGSGYSFNFTTYHNTSSSLRSQPVLRSHTSVIEETATHVVESFGVPLPVLVTEAITTAEKVTDVSVKLDNSGWAGLVCGRRLFVWKFKQESATRGLSVLCKELTLRASDLVHKAELVHIICTKEAQMPSVIAVSPEGIVRYWPNIAHEGNSVEAVADLQGQECYSLTSALPMGCILATTTGSLVLIKLSIANGQHVVTCCPVKIPQGVLAGFGRRVSSFIFGAMPTHSSEAKQLNKVLATVGEDGIYFLYVLSGSALQKWAVSGGVRPDMLIFETDLERFVKEEFVDKYWNGNSALLHHIKIWILDMQLCQKGVILFVAGVNLLFSSDVSFAFGIVDHTENFVNPSFSTFTIIKYKEVVLDQEEDRLLRFKFLFPSPNDEMAYIYDNHKVICASVYTVCDSDVVEFSNHGNIILGAGSCDGLALVFTQYHGVVRFRCTTSRDHGLSSLQGSLKDIIKADAKNKDSPASLPGKLRLAMFAHCNGEFEACKGLISELLRFLVDPNARTTLDEIVLEMSLAVIDDYPVSDPRWCDSVPVGAAVSSSLIILRQLEDKFRAHSHYVNFLKHYGLWEKLSTATTKDTMVSTPLALCENAEKIVAAKTLRKFCNEFPELMDLVIKETLQKRGIERKGFLTEQDLFFREVSCIQNIFPTLLQWQENELETSDNISEENIGNIIETVNNICASTIQVAHHYRESSKVTYNYKRNVTRTQYNPWTSSEEIRAVLLKQYTLNIDHVVRLPDKKQLHGEVLLSFINLITVILDGQLYVLDSFDGKHLYEAEQDRINKEQTRLISPLLEIHQYDRAAALAEKYHNFDLLVEMCDLTDDPEKLHEYFNAFDCENFIEFAFKWYMNKGKLGKLLRQPVVQHYDSDHYLREHRNLSWIHYVRHSEFGCVQQVLKELAFDEHQILARKKTLLSLCKLAVLASDIPSNLKEMHLEAVNFEQDLIMHQETLPAKVCEALGIDLDTVRAFGPEELIEMYVCDENTEANQYDFKIALDLLRFIPKPIGDKEIDIIRQHIWCRAIRRDTWENLDSNNPLVAIKDTLFFRIIDLAFEQGMELHDFLPPISDLLQNPELSDFAENQNFCFLLQAGYEYLEKLV